MKNDLDNTVDRIELLSTLFEGLGNLIVTLGKKEINLHERDFLRNFTTDATSSLNDFAKILTAEELGHLMKFLIELTGHMQNLTNLFQLDPDKKILVGQDILQLSRNSKKLAQNIRERVIHG